MCNRLHNKDSKLPFVAVVHHYIWPKMKFALQTQSRQPTSLVA